MSNDADAERVAELARGVVADHDPKTVPIPEYLGACYDAGLSWERIGMLLESLKRPQVHRVRGSDKRFEKPLGWRTCD